MEKKTLLLVGLGLLLFGGSKKATPGSSTRKLKPGDKLLLVGDSQSVGPDSPGGQLAKLANQFGFNARVLAVGGKTAGYFIKDGLLSLHKELSLRPAAVVVFLGTNELAGLALGVKLEPTLRAHEKLRDIIQKAGARALFVGPPDFGPGVQSSAGGEPLALKSDQLAEGLRAVYGESNFLDARPSTPKPHNEIHFSKKDAQVFAMKLAQAMVGKWS